MLILNASAFFMSQVGTRRYAIRHRGEFGSTASFARAAPSVACDAITTLPTGR